jgi:hypothetical protein
MANPTPTRPTFWLVWCEDGGVPTFKHEHEHFAEMEARRLAERNPGRRFFVLSPVSAFTHHRTVIERFDPTDDSIPF